MKGRRITSFGDGQPVKGPDLDATVCQQEFQCPARFLETAKYTTHILRFASHVSGFADTNMLKLRYAKLSYAMLTHFLPKAI